MRAAAALRLPGRHLVPTLLMMPLLALLLWLGTWQVHRAEEKRLQTAAFESGGVVATSLPGEPTRYARVALEGHYLPDKQVLLDNMTHAGRVGFRVLTPFTTTAGTTLLVDRGWVPLGATRAQLPAVGVDAGPRFLGGRLDELPRAGIDAPPGAGSGWPRVLNYPALPTLEQAIGLPLYPRLVLLDAAATDGYLRDWQPTGLSYERHLGYAVQWYALAATLAVLYVVVGLRKRGVLK